MAEITVALVGCGAVGGVHLACWNNLVGVRITAVCDTDGLAAARLATQYEGTAAFTNIRDMLASQSFDIVDVCTPARQQFKAVAAAIQAGAHVLCETPFTGQPDQARQLAQLADERERLLMPGFCHRFHPPVLFARELLDSDDMGRPAMFRCRFSGLRADLAERGFIGDQTDDSVEAVVVEGALLETAIHGIDLFRAFCGDAASISGRLSRINPDLNVEDTVGAILANSTATGVVEASWSTPGGRNVVEFYGTAGACNIDYDTGTLRYLTADQLVWRGHDEGGPNRFEREIAHFADAVRGLQPLVVTAQDGVRAVELCADLAQQNGLPLQ